MTERRSRSGLSDPSIRRLVARTGPYRSGGARPTLPPGGCRAPAGPGPPPRVPALPLRPTARAGSRARRL